jgi:hypothetical protein
MPYGASIPKARRENISQIQREGSYAQDFPELYRFEPFHPKYLEIPEFSFYFVFQSTFNYTMSRAERCAGSHHGINEDFSTGKVSSDEN